MTSTDKTIIQHNNRSARSKSYGNLTLGKAFSKTQLTFVTVSWDYDSYYDGKDTFKDLIDGTLSSIDSRIFNHTDFVLCAGRSFNIAQGFKKISEAALALTANKPIIFEAFKSRTIKEWRVLFKNKSTTYCYTIRRFQIISESCQLDTRKSPRKARRALKMLGDMLKKDEGLFHFQNQDFRLQLFICGENNFIKERKSQIKKSLFVNGNPLKRIPNFCQDEKWVLVNPSHGPYNRAIEGGGANYTATRKSYPTGPVVGGLVKRKNAYQDGTYPPSAIIHVNNYRQGNRWSERQATRVFTRNKGLRPEKLLIETKGENFIVRKFKIKVQ
jgi:hypothetical protein